MAKARGKARGTAKAKAKLKAKKAKLQIQKAKAELKSQSNKIKSEAKEAKRLDKLKRNTFDYQFTSNDGTTMQGSVYGKRNYKKLMKEITNSKAFASVPNSVRNVNKITNTIMGLEGMKMAAKQMGYDAEVRKIDALAQAWEDVLAMGKDPKLAELLAGIIGKDNTSNSDLLPGNTVIL